MSGKETAEKIKGPNSSSSSVLINKKILKKRELDLDVDREFNNFSQTLNPNNKVEHSTVTDEFMNLKQELELMRNLNVDLQVQNKRLRDRIEGEFN